MRNIVFHEWHRCWLINKKNKKLQRLETSSNEMLRFFFLLEERVYRVEKCNGKPRALDIFHQIWLFFVHDNIFCRYRRRWDAFAYSFIHIYFRFRISCWIFIFWNSPTYLSFVDDFNRIFWSVCFRVLLMWKTSKENDQNKLVEKKTFGNWREKRRAAWKKRVEKKRVGA